MTDQESPMRPESSRLKLLIGLGEKSNPSLVQ